MNKLLLCIVFLVLASCSNVDYDKEKSEWVIVIEKQYVPESVHTTTNYDVLSNTIKTDTSIEPEEYWLTLNTDSRGTVKIEVNKDTYNKTSKGAKLFLVYRTDESEKNYCCEKVYFESPLKK